MSAGSKRGSRPAAAVAPEDEIGEHPPLGRVEARVLARARREALTSRGELTLQERRGVGAGDREHAQRREIADDGAVAGGDPGGFGGRSGCGVGAAGHGAVGRDRVSGSGAWRRASTAGRPASPRSRNCVLKLNVSSPWPPRHIVPRFPAKFRGRRPGKFADPRTSGCPNRAAGDKPSARFEPTAGRGPTLKGVQECPSRCVRCWKPGSTSATRPGTGIRRWPSTSSASATRSTSSTSRRRCSSTRRR